MKRSNAKTETGHGLIGQFPFRFFLVPVTNLTHLILGYQAFLKW